MHTLLLYIKLDQNVYQIRRDFSWSSEKKGVPLIGPQSQMELSLNPLFSNFLNFYYISRCNFSLDFLINIFLIKKVECTTKDKSTSKVLKNTISQPGATGYKQGISLGPNFLGFCTSSCYSVFAW